MLLELHLHLFTTDQHRNASPAQGRIICRLAVELLQIVGDTLPERRAKKVAHGLTW